MKKKTFWLLGSLLSFCLFSTTLAGCKKDSTSNSSISNSTSNTSISSNVSNSSSGNQQDEKKTLTITYEGVTEVGEDITLIVKNEEGEEIKGLPITIKEGNDKVSILMYFVQLLKPGNVTLEIVTEEYQGSLTFTITEKVEEVYSIKQIKTMVSMLQNQFVTTEGIVTASIGNSFYIGDGEAGIYVYNIHAIYTNSDAFVQGSVPVGSKVKVHAKLTNNQYGIQLNGYDGQYLTEAYVKNASNADVETPTRVVIQTEEELKELMKTPYRNGEQISITGQYVSGDLSPLYDDKNAIINMKIDNTEFTLKADRYDLSSSIIKNAWNQANIEVGDILTINSTFTYFQQSQITVTLAGQGTTINNDSKDDTKLRLDVQDKFVSVGKSITLNAFIPDGVEGTLTYEIIKGNEFASIEGNILTGIQTGIIKVVAKIGNLTSYPITIQVLESESQTIADVLNLDKGGNVEVIAKIMAIGNSGFVISDATGSIYVYTGKKAIYDEPEFYNSIGKVVKVIGTVDVYFKNNQKQIVNYTMTDVEDTLDAEIDFTKITASDLANLTDDELNYLIPIHIKGQGEMDENNNMLITVEGLENAVIFVLDYTTWHSMSMGMFGDGSVDADGFIAGKTTYDGTLEYFFYFCQPYSTASF